MSTRLYAPILFRTTRTMMTNALQQVEITPGSAVIQFLLRTRPTNQLIAMLFVPLHTHKLNTQSAACHSFYPTSSAQFQPPAQFITPRLNKVVTAPLSGPFHSSNKIFMTVFCWANNFSSHPASRNRTHPTPAYCLESSEDYVVE